MDIFHFSPAQTFSFILTLFRTSIVIFFLPIFGGQTLPAPVKAAMVLVLTLALWPKLSFPGQAFPSSSLGILLYLFGEMTMGFVIGMTVNFLIAAIQAGGQLAGFSMGFTMVNVLDPITGTEEAVTAHFLYMTSLLVFLTLDGHLFLLQALSESFRLVPPGTVFVSPELAGQVFELSKDLFVLSVKIAAPIIASLFIVDLALALVSKAAPQMNILSLGFPVKTAVGFLFLSLMFQIMARYVEHYIGGLDALFIHLFQAATR